MGTCSKKLKKKRHVSPDIKRFVEDYQEDKLWDYIPGRFHEGFEGVKIQFGVVNPPKFAETMDRLSKNLMVWQNFSKE